MPLVTAPACRATPPCPLALPTPLAPLPPPPQRRGESQGSTGGTRPRGARVAPGSAPDSSSGREGVSARVWWGVCGQAGRIGRSGSPTALGGPRSHRPSTTPPSAHAHPREAVHELQQSPQLCVLEPCTEPGVSSSPARPWEATARAPPAGASFPTHHVAPPPPPAHLAAAAPDRSPPAAAPPGSSFPRAPARLRGGWQPRLQRSPRYAPGECAAATSSVHRGSPPPRVAVQASA